MPRAAYYWKDSCDGSVRYSVQRPINDAESYLQDYNPVLQFDLPTLSAEEATTQTEGQSALCAEWIQGTGRFYD